MLDTEYVVYNEKAKTPVEINIVDVEGNPIEGAEFIVKDAIGNLITEFKTTKEGKGLVLLENGEYIITEAKELPGYELAESVHIRVEDGTYAVLNNDGKEEFKADKTTVVVKDLKGIVINTYGENREKIPISGATFEIYDYYEDKFIGTFTTDENGNIDLKLKNGSYAVIEESMPEKYGTLNNVNVKNQDGNLEILYYSEDIVEEKNEIFIVKELDKTQVVINKTDEDGKLLPGAVFDFERYRIYNR